MTQVVAEPGEQAVAAAEAAEAVASASPERGLEHARLATPIVAHTATDYLSFVGVALLPLLASRIGLTPSEKATLLGLGAVASGVIQPVVAFIGDKLDTRICGPLGLGLAAVCVGLLGWVDSLAALLPVWILLTVGVGAFHPPAAAAVGHLAGRRRSSMLAVFFMAGMVGGVLGNVCSPMWVSAFASWSGREGDAAITAGLRSLGWLLLPGALITGVLCWAIVGRGHRHHDAHERHASLSARERRRRWYALIILYVGNTIRYPVNMALVYLFVEWTTELAAVRATAEQDAGVLASAINGPMQAAMQVGMGGGGILLGLFLRPRIEKPAFVLLPILGLAPIVAFPYADQLPGFAAYALAFGLAVLAGVCFGGMFPASLSLGQRLLPHRTGLASGMLLGGAWAFGFIGAQVARVLHVGARETDLVLGFLARPFGLTGPEGTVGLGLERTFVIVGVVLAISGVFMVLLPAKLLREIDPH